jgi:hypothetical protein
MPLAMGFSSYVHSLTTVTMTFVARNAFYRHCLTRRRFSTLESAGTSPEHTLLVMESRGGSTQGSINKRGKF